MQRNLLTDLMVRRQVRTTAAKAKLAAPAANRLLHLSRKYQTASPSGQLTIYRKILSQLLHPIAATVLVKEIGPHLSLPTVRLTRLSARRGDNSQMIELSVQTEIKKAGLSAKPPKGKKQSNEATT